MSDPRQLEMFPLEDLVRQEKPGVFPFNKLEWIEVETAVLPFQSEWVEPTLYPRRIKHTGCFGEAIPMAKHCLVYCGEMCDCQRKSYSL